MRLNYATTIECDACGTVEQIPPLPDLHIFTEPVPPGWGLPPGLSISDRELGPFRDLCSTCIHRPIADVLNDMLRRATERREEYRRELARKAAL